jgi:uncharacterized YigZ family protein
VSAIYCVPAKEMERETEIKKSRFIARAARVRSREEAMVFLERARGDYPDARHHCWAYLLGSPESARNAAMNDDGEPSGTAGKPILNVIQHKAIGDVMVVVVRYFGGIKLGAGGLVRAYSGAAESVLSQLPLEQRVPMRTALARMDFAHEQAVRRWAAENRAEVKTADYGEQVLLSLELPAALFEQLQAWCLARGISLLPSD